jgi:DNA-binding GntR family transcriptional regulator
MNVSEKVCLTLRRRLMSGFYDPGAQLKEETVAADLGVSRTPVRAAIQRLIAEGLLEPAPKRGAIVTEWRRSDAEDIFNLRIMLEGYSASLAARKISEERIDRMEYLNRCIEEAVLRKDEHYLDVVHRANLEFHQIIYDSCGSGHLRMFGSSLLEFPMVIGGFYIYSDEDMAESIRQHREIVSSLRARNPEWAKAAITCHLAAAIERFRRSQRQPGTSLSQPTEDKVLHTEDTTG